MKFKKLLFGGLLFTAFSLGALQSQAQVQLGVRAGFNLSNITSKDANGNDLNENGKLNPGFHAGVTFDIPVADEFYVQPAALFSTKGGKLNSTIANASSESTITPYYLEVPVNFLYKPEVGNGNLLLGAGPYAAYGLGGKWKTTTTISGAGTTTTNTNNGSLEFVNDVNDASNGNDKVIYGKPFDYGANLLAGYEFSNKLSAQVNAQLGLANIHPNNNGQKPDNKTKNVGFGVSLGYKF